MNRDPDCLFCKIVAGEIPADKVYEDQTVLGFKDINPISPIHILFIPKTHVPTLNDFEDDDALLSDIFKAIKKTARDLGVADDGYRVMMNVNKGGGQEVFHYHVHLVA